MNKLAGWFRKLTNSIPTTTSHVTNEQILLLLDGEVTDSERRRVERHLRECWNCRFRCEEMQRTIHNMVECRNLVVDSRLSSDPPSSRALLAARLEEQRELFATPSRSAMTWFAEYRQAIFAAVACFLMVVTAFSIWRRQPHASNATDGASAQTTLREAISAERAEETPEGRVRHRSMLLRIRNVTTAVDLAPHRVDVWEDAERHRSAIVNAPSRCLAEAKKLSHHADDIVSSYLPPGFESLRAAEFSKLILEPSQLSVTRSKTTQTLLYRPSTVALGKSRQPQILLAQLDLRAVDLHPMAEQLSVVDDGATWEFRLSEEADLEVPLADVPAGIFESPVSEAASASVEVGEAPADASSLDDAVDVLTVLDGAGALTQQDVQLQRLASGGLRVSGVVQDDVRRQALLQLLQPNAGHGLKVQIATIAEQARRSREAKSLLVVDGDPVNDGANAPLTNYFTNTLHLPAAEAERRRLEFENQLLAWSNDAESQAEALHEVLSLVPEGKVSSTSLQVRREWESLVQHHAAALRRDLIQIGTAVLPLQPSASLPPCASQPSPASTDSTELLSSTRHISAGVSNFVAPTGAGTQNGILTPSFGCVLASTEELASRLLTPPPEH